MRIAETSEPASGSEEQNAATFGSSALPKHCGDPLGHLLGRALAEDRRDRERGAHDRHPDPGVAPEQLLVDERQHQPRLVEPELGQALVAVEADLRRLLDHRPRRLLALVPFGGGGADDVGGEAVHPVADVLLVLGELEREGRGRVLAGLADGLLDEVLGGGGVQFAGSEYDIGLCNIGKGKGYDLIDVNAQTRSSFTATASAFATAARAR